MRGRAWGKRRVAFIATPDGGAARGSERRTSNPLLFHWGATQQLRSVVEERWRFPLLRIFKEWGSCARHFGLLAVVALSACSRTSDYHAVLNDPKLFDQVAQECADSVQKSSQKLQATEEGPCKVMRQANSCQQYRELQRELGRPAVEPNAACPRS